MYKRSGNLQTKYEQVLGRNTHAYSPYSLQYNQQREFQITNYIKLILKGSDDGIQHGE
jgi:hypothetical protein